MPNTNLPEGETGLNIAPRLITKAQRTAAAEALGLNPALVRSIFIDAGAREIVVRQFLASTPATAAALNAPAAGGQMYVERHYPFDAEQVEARRTRHEDDDFDEEMAR